MDRRKWIIHGVSASKRKGSSVGKLSLTRVQDLRVTGKYGCKEEVEDVFEKWKSELLPLTETKMNRKRKFSWCVVSS